MTHLIIKHSLRALFLLILLISCIGPASRSARMSSAAVGKSPFRLRLKVENNTLQVGQSTQISVWFLDPDYAEVPNDGTRMIEFRVAAGSTGGGTFSQGQVTVRPGESYKAVTFTAGQAGKIVISARTDGLAAAQTVLLVRSQTGSFLSQLSQWFEPVAYADSGLDLTITEDEVPANKTTKAIFLVSFQGVLATPATVRIFVKAPVSIVCGDNCRSSVTDITLSKDKSVSPDIEVVSSEAGKFEVKAVMLPSQNESGAVVTARVEKHESLTFTVPRPSRICFKDDVNEIDPYGSPALIHVYVADASCIELKLDRPHQITLSSTAPVAFDRSMVEVAPDRNSAESKISLTGLPPGEFKIFALDASGELSLEKPKTILYHRPFEKVVLWGQQAELGRGNSASEISVQLYGKDDKPKKADWDQPINLSASSGRITPAQVTIKKGEYRASAQYIPANSAGKVTLRAEAPDIAPGEWEGFVTTAIYWLVISSLFGGLVGGVVRHISKDYKLERVIPRRTSDGWELGLVGRVGCSIVCGLFLYLTLKLGLSGMLGWALPAGLDLGTKLLAFFFGGLGGFSGTVVFDRLTGSLKLQPQVAN